MNQNFHISLIWDWLNSEHVILAISRNDLKPSQQILKVKLVNIANIFWVVQIQRNRQIWVQFLQRHLKPFSAFYGGNIGARLANLLNLPRSFKRNARWWLNSPEWHLIWASRGHNILVGGAWRCSSKLPIKYPLGPFFLKILLVHKFNCDGVVVAISWVPQSDTGSIFGGAPGLCSLMLCVTGKPPTPPGNQGNPPIPRGNHTKPQATRATLPNPRATRTAWAIHNPHTVTLQQ